MGRRTLHDCHTFAPSSNLHRPQVDEWGGNRGLSGRLAGGSDELGPSRVRFTTNWVALRNGARPPKVYLTVGTSSGEGLHLWHHGVAPEADIW